jgi:catechol 2,3-dioxygenase-like lactoylglutathione lyase family enzyme
MVTLVVRDYDEAIFFTEALRFRLVEDTALTPAKRWVVVAPPGDGAGASLLLAKAATPEQQQAVGRQAGGRVAFFLETADLDGDRAHMLAHGVRFTEEPREEAYGRVVVFEDLYGNRWDLVERR